MITQEQIPSVLDCPVYDSDGNKLGEAKHVFLDDASRQPEWVRPACSS
ncbi:PRC-barrel domain-containing protein [Streptomyces clavifer]